MSTTSRRMWPMDTIENIAKNNVLNDGWNVDDVHFVTGRHQGYVTNDTPTESSDYIYSDFIKVKPGSTIYLKKDGIFLSFFKNNDFGKDYYVWNSLSYPKVTVPENCNYMIYSAHDSEFAEDDVWSEKDYPFNKKYPILISKTTFVSDDFYINRLKTALAVNGAKIRLEKYPNDVEWNLNLAPFATGHNWTGFAIGNDVTLEFGGGVKMTAIFDNTDRWIYDHFSPFDAVGNFTLINANIEAQNCRYCFHDDQDGYGSSEGESHNYINCIMKYTNTHTDINYVQCIGGGLGFNTVINIDGGRYESNSTVPYNGLTLQQTKQPITYHNGGNGHCSSIINIKNVYANGHFRFGYYGSSTYKTPITISGCSTEDATVVSAETDNSTINNFNLIEFNNELRNK